MRGYITPAARAALRKLGTDDPRGDADHRHPGQSLEGAAPVLGLYYRALAARNVALLPFGDKDDPQQYPDTHSTIRLPERIARFPRAAANFEWYKVALTHRAAHYEGGTFGFRFDAPAPHFPTLRPPLDTVARHEHESDLETFFRLFAQRELAVEIFTVSEDLRLDAWAKRRYPGVRAAFARVQAAALADRPDVATLRPRDALAETLVRLSLGAHTLPPLPKFLHDSVREMAAVTSALEDASATVEDSAEAALRIYTLLTRLPNLEADYGPVCEVDRAAPAPPIVPATWPEPERIHLEGDEVLATTFAPVLYRDRLGSRYTFYRGAGPLDQQAIYRFTATERTGDARPVAAGAGADDDDRPQSPPEPLEHDHHDHFGADLEQHAPGELHSHEVSSFVYPEWDHVLGAYRRNWCMVRESRLDPAPSARYFDETLQAYGELVPEIRRQIERLSREGLRKVRRMADGEEIDLDAAIEVMVDRRAGLSPSDHVYTSRQKLARDVAVAFLVDMSSSTAEHVADDAPTEHALALAPGRRLHGRSYRTILDLEKESMALLMSALERIGDAYGIYCFSGSGREDVRFLVLKDLEERLSDRIAARLESMKPHHTTRMGAAVRHTIRKLRAQEARTKLLMLLSDGRPFDLDYGQAYGEGAEVEYAIHDTREALEEARRAGISPFVLTVDPQGNDYLRTLCDGLDYEVLRDVRELPSRLLRLYRALTGG